MDHSGLELEAAASLVGQIQSPFDAIAAEAFEELSAVAV